MRFLRTVEICGRQFRVLEVTPEEHPDIGDGYGCCDSDSATICISTGSADTVQIDTLFHEITHAVLEATGLRTKIQSSLDSGGSLEEEEIVTVMTPALRAALKSSGWREPKRVAKVQRKRATNAGT